MDVESRDLADWIAQISQAEMFEIPLDGEAGVQLLSNVSAAARQAGHLLEWARHHEENLLWVLQYAIAEAIWTDQLDLALRIGAVRAIPVILDACCKFPACSVPSFQFWESVLDPWKRDHHADPRHPIALAIGDALLKQLTLSRTDCTQLSALHGVNHL